MPTLYQMPVSHFCEKARWALHFKRIPYKIKNLLPGLHASKARHLTGQTSLPVLKEGRTSIANSADIIDYLDAEYPRFPLTPEDKEFAEQARDWERFADKEIGPAVRQVGYSVLLAHPEVLTPMFAQDGPWYSGFYLKKAFPRIKSALERGYLVNDKDVAESKERLHRAMEKQLSAQSEKKPMLDCGFSRADLALASLWAPFFGISKFGLDKPESPPQAFRDLAKEYSAIEPWVRQMYAKYR